MIRVQISRGFAVPIGIACLLGSPHSRARDAYEDEASEQRPSDESRGGDRDGDEEELQAGGLRAPEAMGDHGHGESRIEKDLEESDRKDAGRGLEFVYVSGDAGYGLIGLSSFSSKGLLPDGEKGHGSGALLGAGLGVRLLYFTLGGRFRYGLLSRFDMVSVMAELGVRFPLGGWEPFVTFGAGYVSFHDFRLHTPPPDQLRVVGGNLRLAGGVDYYFSDSFSMGACAAAETLLLGRRAQGSSESCSDPADCPYVDKGSAIGGGLSLTLSAGLHF